VPVIQASFQKSPAAIALDSTYVYWVDGSSVSDAG
jgi:hypothetical protein